MVLLLNTSPTSPVFNLTPVMSIISHLKSFFTAMFLSTTCILSLAGFGKMKISFEISAAVFNDEKVVLAKAGAVQQ